MIVLAACRALDLDPSVSFPLFYAAADGACSSTGAKKRAASCLTSSARHNHDPLCSCRDTGRQGATDGWTDGESGREDRRGPYEKKRALVEISERGQRSRALDAPGFGGERERRRQKMAGWRSHSQRAGRETFQTDVR